MSVRITSYRVDNLSDKDAANLIKNISNDNFDSNRSCGFLTKVVNSEIVESRYVKKITGVVKVVDPLGETLEFPQISYIEQRFILAPKLRRLTLFDTNACWKHLTGKLSEFSDFKIAIVPLAIDLGLVYQEMKEAFDQLKIYSATIAPLQLPGGATAHVTVEGSDDARLQARAFLKPRKISYSSIKCEFDFANRIRKCELKSHGPICIYGDRDPLLENAFLKLLASVHKLS